MKGRYVPNCSEYMRGINEMSSTSCVRVAPRETVGNIIQLDSRGRNTNITKV